MQTNKSQSRFVAKAENGGIGINKDKMTSAVATDDGVLVFLCDYPHEILITSDTQSPVTILKKIADSMRENKPTAVQLIEGGDEKALVSELTERQTEKDTKAQPQKNCLIYAPCAQESHVKTEPFQELLKAPKIHRGNLNDEELTGWLRSVANDIQSISAREEIIPALMKDVQDAEERLSATKLRLTEAFCQQAQDPGHCHGTCDTN